MQPLILSLSAISLLMLAIHMTAGERQIAQPMLKASFDPVARYTMYVCWHGISAQIALATAALAWIGFHPPSDAHQWIVGLFGALYLAYAALFVGIARWSKRPRALVELGQWIVFLPTGLLAMVAAL